MTIELRARMATVYRPLAHLDLAGPWDLAGPFTDEDRDHLAQLATLARPLNSDNLRDLIRLQGKRERNLQGATP